MAAGHGQKMSRRWEVAIACLLSEPTLEAAATKAGVSLSALKKWLKEPEFATAFREARTEVLRVAVTRLTALSSKAVEALDRNLTAGTPGAEIRAALGVLDQCRAGLEVLDLAEELLDLRRQLEAMKRGDGDSATGS